MDSRSFPCFLRILAALVVVVSGGARLQAASPIVDPDLGLGITIWADHFSDGQECRFVRSFTIPSGAKVRSARLRITADNSFEVFLDGQRIGQGSDWRVLTEYELRLLLHPGEHVLAVSAVNNFDIGGLMAGLRVTLEDGRVIEVLSDDFWKIAPNNRADWLRNTKDWKAWPRATKSEPLMIGTHPLIYQAPVSQPVRIEFWQRKEFQFALAAVALASIATGLFLASRLYLKLRMEQVVSRERERIAADLHDDLGGGLTQLVLLGETTRPSVAADSPAAEAMERVCDQSRALLSGMNEAVWLINSQRDTLRDLASYAAKYAERFFDNTAVRCRFDIDAGIPPWPCDIGIRRNLFLAIKEALHNVLRHSHATTVHLEIRRQRQELVVIIRDNGRGFDPGAPSGGNGNGLHNMRRRAAEAGGSLTIHSKPEDGSTLEFRIPMQKPAPLRFPWTRGRQPAQSKGQAT